MKSIPLRVVLGVTLFASSVGLTSTAFATQICEDIFTEDFGKETSSTAPLGSRENPMEMKAQSETSIATLGSSDNPLEMAPREYRINKFTGERVPVTPKGKSAVKPAQPFEQPQNDDTKFVVTPPKKEGLFSKVLSFFKHSDLKAEVTFVGKTLSDVQFRNLKRTANKSGSPITAGDKITVLSREMLEGDFESIIGGMEVHKNGAFEDALLRESTIDSDPREALSVRIHTHDDVIETGILIVGDVTSVSAQATQSALGMFLRQNQIEGITQIEIAHTHPAYAVTVESQSGFSKSALHEISDGDVIEASKIRRMLPSHIGVIIKAIVPNGFNYVGYIN